MIYQVIIHWRNWTLNDYIYVVAIAWILSGLGWTVGIAMGLSASKYEPEGNYDEDYPRNRNNDWL